MSTSDGGRRSWVRDVALWFWMRPAWYGVAHGAGMAVALLLGLPFTGASLDQTLFRAVVLGTVWGVCLGLQRHRALGRDARRTRVANHDGQRHRSEVP